MDRTLLIFFVAVSGLAGCCNPPPPVRMVPAASVRQLDPQPFTLAEFRAAEEDGHSPRATGVGLAWNLGDQRIHLHPGERLHVLGVNEKSGRIAVRRVDEGSVASVERDGVEVLTTSYPN